MDFMTTGETKGSIEEAVDLIGFRALRVVGANLLAWLRAEGLRKESKDLDLDPAWPWAKDARKLINQVGAFGNAFTVTETSLTFSDAVLSEERKQMAIEVRNGYMPQQLD